MAAVKKVGQKKSDFWLSIYSVPKSNPDPNPNFISV